MKTSLEIWEYSCGKKQLHLRHLDGLANGQLMLRVGLSFQRSMALDMASSKIYTPA